MEPGGGVEVGKYSLDPSKQGVRQRCRGGQGAVGDVWSLFHHLQLSEPLFRQRVEVGAQGGADVDLAAVNRFHDLVVGAYEIDPGKKVVRVNALFQEDRDGETVTGGRGPVGESDGAALHGGDGFDAGVPAGEEDAFVRDAVRPFDGSQVTDLVRDRGQRVGIGAGIEDADLNVVLLDVSLQGAVIRGHVENHLAAELLGQVAANGVVEFAELFRGGPGNLAQVEDLVFPARGGLIGRGVTVGPGEGALTADDLRLVGWPSRLAAGACRRKQQPSGQEGMDARLDPALLGHGTLLSSQAVSRGNNAIVSGCGGGCKLFQHSWARPFSGWRERRRRPAPSRPALLRR